MAEPTDQEQVRRESLEYIREYGIDPYPPESFDVNVHAKEIEEGFDEEENNYQDVRLAGRLVAKRGKGKVIFADLQDNSGRIQIYLKRDVICPGEDNSLYNDIIKKQIDLGDVIGVEGDTFRTNRGEVTVRVKKFRLLAKTLKPLPVVKVDAEGKKHDAFSDPEARYRQRYLDLSVNPGVRERFGERSRMISVMRRFFDGKGWLEVETPVLQPVHGGAAARPFKTYHKTLDMPYYLRIANELYLKRLIIGGYEGVYEIGKMFRNEGMDRTHNPEFTSMELYVAYKDYFWMMETVEECLEYIVREMKGDAKVEYRGETLDFEGPYERITMFDALKQHAGLDVEGAPEEQLRSWCEEYDIELEDSKGRGKLIDELFGELVEPKLVQPTFIMDYPVEMTPLAKSHREKEGLVERFELFVSGKELANAYTELNDPDEQRERFEQQLKLAERGDEEAMALDEDFLKAMQYGLPPTAGLGIGVDRLAMILTGQTSIQEVLFFPQMRPENE